MNPVGRTEWRPVHPIHAYITTDYKSCVPPPLAAPPDAVPTSPTKAEASILLCSPSVCIRAFMSWWW